MSFWNLLSSWPSFWTPYPSTEDNADSLSLHLGLLSHPWHYVYTCYSQECNHSFSFTGSKCYKLTFPFLETSIHQVQSFTNCPVQQSDPSIICLTNPQTPMNLSKTSLFHILIYQPVDNSKILRSKLHPNNNIDLHRSENRKYQQTANINTMSSKSQISPPSHFPGIDPTFLLENQIPNCTSGEFPTIQTEVPSIFLPAFSAFFLT